MKKDGVAYCPVPHNQSLSHILAPRSRCLGLRQGDTKDVPDLLAERQEQDRCRDTEGGEVGKREKKNNKDLRVMEKKEEEREMTEMRRIQR